MFTRRVLDEDTLLRLGAQVTGGLFLVAAGFAAELARDHMALSGICGAGPHPHCGWCFGAASLALSGLAAFGFAFRRPT